MKKIISLALVFAALVAPTLAEATAEFDPIAALDAESEIVEPESDFAEAEQIVNETLNLIEEVGSELAAEEEIKPETTEESPTIEITTETETILKNPTLPNIEQISENEIVESFSQADLTDTLETTTEKEKSFVGFHEASDPTAISKFITTTETETSFDYSSETVTVPLSSTTPSFSYSDYLSPTATTTAQQTVSALPKTGAGIAVALIGSLAGATIFRRKKC